MSPRQAAQNLDCLWWIAVPLSPALSPRRGSTEASTRQYGPPRLQLALPAFPPLLGERAGVRGTGVSASEQRFRRITAHATFRSAFTLIEIMIVVAIMAVVMAMSIPFARQ